MSNLSQLFSQLCGAIEAFEEMQSSQKKRAAVRNAGAGALDLAISLLPEIIKQDLVQSALLAAMRSKSTVLINAFPAAPYGTYTISQETKALELWARDCDPDVILALSSRGLQMTRAHGPLLTRAFRQQDDRLRAWALTYLAARPDDFHWLNDLTPHNIGRRPEFAEALVEKSVKSSALAAQSALVKAFSYRSGLSAALLLHAGVVLPQGATDHYHRTIPALSNHAKLRVMRNSITAFAQDAGAIRASKKLFEA